MRAAASRRRCASCPGCRTSTRDLQITNPQVNVDARSRADRRARPDRRSGRVRAVVAYGSRQVSQIFAPERRVPGDHAGRAGVPAGSGGAVDALRAGAGRQAGAAVGGRHDASDASARCRSTTSASCRRSRSRSTSQPGVALGDAVARGRAARARDAAGDGRRQLPGHGAGVPGLDARPRLDPACWRSSSSTSCSASSTRASSTR